VEQEEMTIADAQERNTSKTILMTSERSTAASQDAKEPFRQNFNNSEETVL